MSTDKFQVPSSKLQISSNLQAPTPKQKIYELGERTFFFAQQIIQLCNQLSNSTANRELTKQLIRSAGSVGANYIEANESITKKDFRHKIMICLKEAKESNYWLRLISSSNGNNNEGCQELMQESGELVKIFASILNK